MSSDTEAGKLEERVLKVFEKLDVNVDPKVVEDWIVTGLKLEIMLRNANF